MNTRIFCTWCRTQGKKSNKWYFEYNEDWHGMKVLQRACVKCGFAVALYTLNESSILLEKEEIKAELEKIN